MWGQKWLNHSEVVSADSSLKETIWSWRLGLSEMGWVKVRGQMSRQVIRASLASFHHSILSWKLQHLTDSVIHLFWRFWVWLPDGWVYMVSLRISKKQLIFDLSGYSLQRMKNLRIRVNAKIDLKSGGKKLFYVETRQQKTYYQETSAPVVLCFTFWTCQVDNRTSGSKVNPIKQRLKLWKVSGPLQSTHNIGDTYQHMDRIKDQSEMKKVFRDSAFVFCHSHISTGAQHFSFFIFL